MSSSTTKTGSNRTAKKAASAAKDIDSLNPWPLSSLVAASVALYVFYIGVSSAYKIRLVAIKEYGPVIHEFDPYFNYRATEVRVHCNDAISFVRLELFSSILLS